MAGKNTSKTNEAKLAIASNPYVAVLTKKLRKVNKRLEKIINIEKSAAAGKAINKDQEAILGDKAELVTLQEEYNAIKEALIAVAKAEAETEVTVEAVVKVAVEPVVAEVEEAVTKEVSIEAAPEVATVATETLVLVETVPVLNEETLRVLLGVFHICERQSNRLMTKSVENSAVEYLYSYLAGKDSPRDFGATLTKAVDTAKSLVTLATDGAIAGITYAELHAHVAGLLAAPEVIVKAPEFSFMGESNLSAAPAENRLWDSSPIMAPMPVPVVPFPVAEPAAVIEPIATVSAENILAVEEPVLAAPVVEVAVVAEPVVAAPVEVPVPTVEPAQPVPVAKPVARVAAWGSNKSSLIKKAPTKPIASRRPSPIAKPTPVAKPAEEKKEVGGRRGGKGSRSGRRGSARGRPRGGKRTNNKAPKKE